MKDSIIANLTGTPDRRRAQLAALLVVLVWAVALLVGGCTSDPASLVGAGLIDNEIDETLANMEILTIESFAGIRVNNTLRELPLGRELTEQEALYLGSEANTQTSFMANFEFSDIDESIYPDELFTAENIKNVFFSLTKLNVYGAFDDSLKITCDGNTGECDTVTVVYPVGDNPQELYYFVHELAVPFVPEDYNDYPAVVPDFDPTIIVRDFHLPVEGDLPRLPMFEADFLGWYEAGTPVGILVQLGPLSDPGLVGFASGDLITFSEIPLDAVGTIPGPNLIIEFEDQSIPNLLIGPADDTTVFEDVAPAAETAAEAGDGFMLRTGLRSYPAIRFDLAQLPANVLVNRAVFSVTNDTSTSYGPEFSIMVSEIVASVMDDPSRVMDVVTILDSTRVYPLGFRANLRPKEDFVIEFDITTGIRRAVNRVNEEPRGFLLSGVENRGVFPFGNLPPDLTRPDFYYRQMNLLGLDDPDPQHRPHLKIWYSVVDELTGGGQ